MPFVSSHIAVPPPAIDDAGSHQRYRGREAEQTELREGGSRIKSATKRPREVIEILDDTDEKKDHSHISDRFGLIDSDGPLAKLQRKASLTRITVRDFLEAMEKEPRRLIVTSLTETIQSVLQMMSEHNLLAIPVLEAATFKDLIDVMDIADVVAREFHDLSNHTATEAVAEDSDLFRDLQVRAQALEALTVSEVLRKTRRERNLVRVHNPDERLLSVLARAIEGHDAGLSGQPLADLASGSSVPLTPPHLSSSQRSPGATSPVSPVAHHINHGDVNGRISSLRPSVIQSLVENPVSLEMVARGTEGAAAMALANEGPLSETVPWVPRVSLVPHRAIVLNTFGMLLDVFSLSDVVRFLYHHEDALGHHVGREVGQVMKEVNMSGTIGGGIVSVQETQTALSAFCRMHEANVSSVLVVGMVDGKPKGVLSASDLRGMRGSDFLNLLSPVLEFRLRHSAPQRRPTSQLYVCRSRETLHAALGFIVEHKLHRVFVEAEGKPVGVLSLSDILELCISINRGLEK